jgi:hypothetical protein
MPPEENNNTQTTEQPQGDIQLAALQEQINNMQKDLSARDKKINEMDKQLKLKDAEVATTQATAKQTAALEVQNDYEERIRQLEQQNKNMFIQNTAAKFNIPVDEQLMATLGQLDREQAASLLERQAKLVEDTRKTALEQRSNQDMAYLQRAGIQKPQTATVPEEYDYYG